MRFRQRGWLPAVAVGLPLVCSTTAAVAGPVSPLYLSAGVAVIVVQGSSVLRSWNTNYNQHEYPIAVQSTVRLLGMFPGEQGEEFTLAGIPTGTVYTNPLSIGPSQDGATDGSFNYALDEYTQQVDQFDTNWGNPGLLFSIPGAAFGQYEGIAYDRTNDSFWVSTQAPNANENGVLDLTRSGTVLSSFNLPTDKSIGVTYTGLALDPADNTLWVVSNYSPLAGSNVALSQYSKAGTLLSVQPYPSLNYYINGAEFQFPGAPVPEPSPAAMLMAGGGLFAAIWWRRRTYRAHRGTGSRARTFLARTRPD